MRRGFHLYARSRILPLTMATLVGIGVLTAVCADRWDAHLDPARRVPLVALAPLLASAAIGVSLHQSSPDLDRTSVRRWWPRRLAHLAALTALAVCVLALAVPGSAREFGALAMVRTLLGTVGLTAGAAAILGARLSWLPTLVYLGTAYLAGAGARGRVAALSTWAIQPGGRPDAWGVAVAAFVAGSAAYAVHGTPAEDVND